MSLFNELKRRNVFRVAIAYLVVGWLLVQVLGIATDSFEAPTWVMKLIITMIVIGFIPTVLFSWAFELTPEGIKRDKDVNRDDSITHNTAKKLDILTIFALLTVGTLVIWQQFSPSQNNANQLGNESVTTTNEIQNNNTNIPDQTIIPAAKPDISLNPEIYNKSIAVLPFINRSDSQDDQFFADGIQDDLLTKLAKIHEMKVISRTSVMEYRDTTKKIPDIAKELGVANILEGGVQRAGSHIRINAQLIHAETDEHLWAETYDRELNVDNVFAIQTEITVAIAAALKATLTPAEKDQISKPLTDNLMAWEAYNEGLSYASGNSEDFNKQIKLFNKAIELDPNFSAAYAQLSIAEMGLYWWGENTPEQKQRAWNAIEKSRSLDNNSANLFAAEAFYYYWGFRAFSNALDSVNKALKLSPNLVGAYDVKGYILRRMGRFDESIQVLDIAASLNPRSTYALQENAETLVNLLRFEEAEKYIKKVEIIKPNNRDISLIKGHLAYGRTGNVDEALIQYARNVEILPSSAIGYWRTLLSMNRMDQAIEFAKTSSQFVSAGFSYSSNNHMTGLSYFLNDQATEAASYLSKSVNYLESKLKESGEDKNLLVALCQGYAARGDIINADANCQKALKIKHDAYDYPWDLLSVIEAYAMLNENAKAIELMHHLLESEIRPSEIQLKLNPFLKKLHHEPEFEILAKRIGSGELVHVGDSQ